MPLIRAREAGNKQHSISLSKKAFINLQPYPRSSFLNGNPAGLVGYCIFQMKCSDSNRQRTEERDGGKCLGTRAAKSQDNGP